MKKNNIIILFLLMILLLSCNDKKWIYYSYKGVTVTRIDEPKITYLYFGRFDSKSKLPNCYVKIEYLNRGDFFIYYLTFQKEKIILHNDEGIYKSNFAFNMQIMADDVVEFVNFKDTIEKNGYSNTIYIEDYLPNEIKRNNKFHSQVKAEYPIEVYNELLDK
ncbi:MAG: hypothetical protein WCH34_12050 [Bacteroidota bacterium]